MKALITGAAGFIGSNLFERCKACGWQVDGVDDLSNGHVEFVRNEYRQDLYTCDFSDNFILNSIKRGRYDVIIHLAAVPRVSYSVEHPLETNDTNVSKSLKLIDACRDNVKRFVFASSSSVYGGADVLPTPTNAMKNPQSPYALQKSIIEEYLTLYTPLYGLESVALRFFNVFGPNCLGDSPYATAVSAWLTAIKKGQSMRSDGDGMQSRDMCYVDNVTQACMLATTADVSSVPANLRRFNVACGEAVTNNDVLAYLTNRYPNAKTHSAPTRAGDVKHTLADISLTKSVLGYEPEVTVWHGIAKTADWYDANWDRVKGLKLNT